MLRRWPLGPLAFHQPEDLHVVQVRKARRLRVEDPNAAARRRDLERLRAKPAADGRGQLGDRAGRGGIVPAIRRGQAVERRDHRRAGAAAAIVVLAVVARRGTAATARPDRPSAGDSSSGASAVAVASAARAAGRSAPVHVSRQCAQAIEAAEVALLRHRRVECGDRRAVDFGAVDTRSGNAASEAAPSSRGG